MTELQREKNREYQKKYYEKNKKVLYERKRIKYANRTEKQKEIDIEYRKKYYQENKEKVREHQKKYNNANREKVTKICINYRKRKAEEYKAQGQMYCFLPRTQRETRMIEKLAYKKKISTELSRELLMKNDWNIKKLLIEEVVYNA